MSLFQEETKYALANNLEFNLRLVGLIVLEEENSRYIGVYNHILKQSAVQRQILYNYNWKSISIGIARKREERLVKIKLDLIFDNVYRKLILLCYLS